MAHSSSGLGHRPLKAEILSNSELPSEPTSDLGARQALEDYVIHLKNRGISDRHISDLLVYLEKYCEWHVNTCEHLSAKSAEKYLSKSNHLKPNSRAKYATYLKGLLNYLGIPFDLTVKVPKTLPEYVEVSEIEKIVEWIKNRKTYRNTIEADLILIETLKKTGMRRSELGNLKVEDTNLDKNRLYVRRGKGDKE